MIQLSKRLRMNASLVTAGHRLADVGTDHGYIPIVLVQEGKIPSALAMDVNQGPLKRAEEHIKEYQLNSYIHIRLSDGVQNLQPQEADSVLIAGMGGALVIKILQEGKEVLQTVKELILQPQSEIEKVRHYLEDAGYCIVEEDMVLEDGKYYPVMKAKLGNMHYDREIEYLYGKILLDKKHPVLKDFLERKMDNSSKIMQKLKQDGKQEERMLKRMQELQDEMLLMQEALKRFEA